MDTNQPSKDPTRQPMRAPSRQPSKQPVDQPSSRPTARPSNDPYGAAIFLGRSSGLPQIQRVQPSWAAGVPVVRRVVPAGEPVRPGAGRSPPPGPGGGHRCRDQCVCVRGGAPGRRHITSRWICPATAAFCPPPGGLCTPAVRTGSHSARDRGGDGRLGFGPGLVLGDDLKH